jgi:glycosyltransferase involved in cell wall biosynthesis
MRVDVIVTTYNRAGMLEAALRSLLRQELGGISLRIIVVDNGSTDGTRAVVEHLRVPPQVSVRYVAEQEQGVAHARNRGLRESTADWIAFLDDDEVADPAWLRELIAAAVAAGATCVGGRVALEDHAAVRRLRPFCRALLGETPEGAAAERFRGKRLPGTGNVLIRRAALDAVDPFDGSLASGAEDSDFFSRLRDAGHPAWFSPRAQIVHRVPPYRTSARYLLWVASRHGANAATLDRRRRGRGRVLRDALLRAAQAVAITVPALLLALVTGDAARALEGGCRLARAVGYGREALRILAPRAFPQRAFVGRLALRTEGERFGNEDPAAP